MSSLVLAWPQSARLETARLFNRNFLLLWQAQLVSQFGNQAFTIAMMVWTADATGSATITGLILMASVLPVVVLGPLTGAFADGPRCRLRIVTTCDLLCGALVTLLAVGFLAGPDAWRPGMLFAIALAVGVCNAFFDPAVNALIPDLVPRGQIEAANAFRQSSRQITVLSAQGLGGILYALVGPAILLLLDGLSFLFAGASEMLIRTPRDRATPPTDRSDVPGPAHGFFGQAADGFRYVAAQPGMIGFLVAVSAFNALLMPMTLLLPVYATAYLQAGVRWYGFLLASISAGALAGCMLIGTTHVTLSGGSRRLLLLTAFAALALALAALGQIRSPWLALAMAAATGALTGMINVIVLSIIQRRAAGPFRGRVIGLHAMMTRVLVPVGLVAGGTLADLTGRNVPLVYGVCGALALTAVIALAAGKTTRTFLASS